MRATLRDVARRPRRIVDWWQELPMRRRVWWWQLLREPGQGWLRWDYDECVRMSYDPPDYESWPIAPPARLVALWLRAWLMFPVGVARGWWSWNEPPLVGSRVDDRSRPTTSVVAMSARI